MMTNAGPPAGWYDDAHDPGRIRYWNGAQWTDKVAPKVVVSSAPPPSPVLAVNASASASAHSSEAAERPRTQSDGSAAASLAPGMFDLRAKDRVPKSLIVILSIAGASLLVLIIAAVIGGGSAERTTAAVSSSPTPAATQPAPEPAPEVTTEATSTPMTTVEPVAFGPEAVKHLGDYTKDLDDMIITVEEAGYWRLLSNSLELSFNVGQLEALTAPASSSAEWSAGIAELAAATTRIIDSIDMDDYGPVRAEIDAVRGTVAALTEIASRP